MLVTDLTLSSDFASGFLPALSVSADLISADVACDELAPTVLSSDEAISARSAVACSTSNPAGSSFAVLASAFDASPDLAETAFSDVDGVASVRATGCSRAGRWSPEAVASDIATGDFVIGKALASAV